jgi:hypothetical protein
VGAHGSVTPALPCSVPTARTRAPRPGHCRPPTSCRSGRDPPSRPPCGALLCPSPTLPCCYKSRRGQPSPPRHSLLGKAACSASPHPLALVQASHRSSSSRIGFNQAATAHRCLFLHAGERRHYSMSFCFGLPFSSPLTPWCCKEPSSSPAATAAMSTLPSTAGPSLFHRLTVTQQCPTIFLIFYFRFYFQKIVETSKIHRKYNKTQKI